ncbi:hypothetical protein Bbelb_247170 [Branchiostoma belcheri]|nr:hypothetical protein Bbelb_247170 [Branchiostoma belcheri]
MASCQNRTPDTLDLCHMIQYSSDKRETAFRVFPAKCQPITYTPTSTGDAKDYKNGLVRQLFNQKPTICQLGDKTSRQFSETRAIPTEYIVAFSGLYPRIFKAGLNSAALIYCAAQSSNFPSDERDGAEE